MIVTPSELNSVASIIATGPNINGKGSFKTIKKLLIDPNDNGASVTEAIILIYLYLSYPKITDYTTSYNIKRFIEENLSKTNKKRLKSRIYYKKPPSLRGFIENSITERILKELKDPLFCFNYKNRNVKPAYSYEEKPKTCVYNQLNEDQLKAVKASEKNVLVVANAGTGKTTVLVERALYLIKERQINPERLLLITFTIKAAREMESRILNSLRSEETVSSSIECRTFHSWAYKLVMSNYRLFGFKTSPSIMNEGYSVSLLKEIIERRKREKIISSEIRDIDIIGKISFIRNREKDLRDFFNSNGKYRYLYEIFTEYSLIKKSRNLIDFDDLLELVSTQLLTDTNFRTTVSSYYDHILVDEVQDCNNHQFRILKRLSSANKDLSIFACGDEKQSIYAFRSSDYRNMSKFILRFKASVYYLTINYRSFQEILDVANITAKCLSFSEEQSSSKTKDMIGVRNFEKNGKFAKKSLPVYKIVSDAKEEYHYIINNIKNLFRKGVKAKDIVLLFRTNAEILESINAFKHSGIPFVRKGHSVRKEPYIKIFLNLILASTNFSNKELWESLISFFITKNKDACNLIYNSFLSIERKMGEQKLPFQVIPLAERQVDNVLKCLVETEVHQNYKRTFFDLVVNALKCLTEKSETGCFSCYNSLQKAKNIMLSVFKEKYPKKTQNSMNRIMNEFVTALSGTAQNDIEHLVNVLVLEPELVDEDITNLPGIELEKKYGGRVTFSTIHNYKGLESKVVFLVNCIDRLLPLINNKMDFDLIDKHYHINEERRLFYVACTRAKDKLYIIAPVNKEKGEKESRFITEINSYLKNNKIDKNVFSCR